MIWLGLATTIAFVPGWTGATIPTGWAVLSCFLPLTLWRPARWSVLHWVLFAGLAWAALSTTWGLRPNAVMALWQLSIFFLAFHLGYTTRDLRGLIHGIAIGMTVSVGVEFAQEFGWNILLNFSGAKGTGLFYNTAAHGMMLAAVIIALVVERLWLYIPALAVGLALTHSRGAIVLLAAGLVAQTRRPALVLAAGAATILVATFFDPSSNAERLLIWRWTVQALSVFGHGPGSFLSMYYIRYDHALVHPEFVHNDYLQLAFEYGIGAAPWLAVFAAVFLTPTARYWPVWVCFCGAALFYFPLHLPTMVLIYGAAAGSCACDWALVWDHRRDWGPRLLSRLHPRQSPAC